MSHGRIGRAASFKRLEHVQLVGRKLPASKPVFIALPRFKGIGPRLAEIICARLQISKNETMQSLSEARAETLALFLSAPKATAGRPVMLPSNIQATKQERLLLEPTRSRPTPDPLEGLTLDTELVRETRRSLQKLFNLGLIRGFRHAKGLPVWKPRYAHRAHTARRLNKIERIS